MAADAAVFVQTHLPDNQHEPIDGIQHISLPATATVSWAAKMSKIQTLPDACSYVVGDDGLASWSDTHAEAWIGLLESHKELTRTLDAELWAAHGLSLSGLELLGRLAAAENRHLRLSELAQAAGLSLSRVSRIIDLLEARGLVGREPCAEDARAVEAHLTYGGLQLVREAQTTHFASVQQRFFDKLQPGELEVLAAVFGRLSPRAAAACTTDVVTTAANV